MITIKNISEFQNIAGKVMTAVIVEEDDRIYQEEIANKIRKFLNKELSMTADLEVV